MTEQNAQKPKVKITTIENHTGWTFGIVDGVPFEAKVYDEPSKYGIKKGRISKLYIKDVCAYDRSWDIKPNTRHGWAMLSAILEYFDGKHERTNPVKKRNTSAL